MKTTGIVTVLLGVLALGLSIGLRGQAPSWTQLVAWIGPGADAGGPLLVDSAGVAYAAFTFRQNRSWDNSVLVNGGSDDLLLLQRQPGGHWKFFLHGAGPQEDETTALATDPQGDLYLAGSFWSTLQLDSTTLRVGGGRKGLVLGRWGRDGSLRWAQAIAGSGLKKITGLQVNRTGTIFLAGYFSDTLFIGSQTLVTSAASSGFLATLTAAGQLQWVQVLGEQGNTQPVALALPSDDRVAICGYFDLSLRLGDTTFVANTTDQDLFVVQWQTDGRLVWARRAGGVFDATPVGMVNDPQGNLYVAGNLVGVLRFNERWTIQSRDGNADCFVAAYSPGGQVLRARVFGGDQVQQLTALSRQGSQLLLTGTFLGDLNLDPLQIKAGQQFTGFVAALDTLFQGQWLLDLPSSGGVYPTGIAAASSSEIVVNGAYRGQGRWGTLPLPPATDFDGFLLSNFSPVTATTKPVSVPEPFLLFPNPADQFLNLRSSGRETWELTLFNALGELVIQTRTPTIGLASVPAGPYWVRLTNGQATWWRQVIVVHE